jgi:hypothetical protein
MSQHRTAHLRVSYTNLAPFVFAAFLQADLADLTTRGGKRRWATCPPDPVIKKTTHLTGRTRPLRSSRKAHHASHIHFVLGRVLGGGFHADRPYVG